MAGGAAAAVATAPANVWIAAADLGSWMPGTGSVWSACRPIEHAACKLTSRWRMLVAPQLDQESVMEANATAGRRAPWNKGKIVGQKAPFKLKPMVDCFGRKPQPSRASILRCSTAALGPSIPSLEGQQWVWVSASAFAGHGQLPGTLSLSVAREAMFNWMLARIGLARHALVCPAQALLPRHRLQYTVGSGALRRYPPQHRHCVDSVEELGSRDAMKARRRLARVLLGPPFRRHGRTRSPSCRQGISAGSRAAGRGAALWPELKPGIKRPAASGAQTVVDRIVRAAGQPRSDLNRVRHHADACRLL
jgi:hypothetical protein